MEDEKRKSIRIGRKLVVKYSKDGRIWDISHIINFSETGMQITTRVSLEIGEILLFRTKIPLEPFTWLEFSGKIVDCQKLKTESNVCVSDTHITRIEFKDINEEQKGLLKKYISWSLIHRPNTKA